MNIKISIILGAGMLLSSAACQKADRQLIQNNQGAQVIYGEDGRVDLYDVEDENVLKIASSTVALIESKNLTLEGDKYKVAKSSFGAEYSLCASEPFREQGNKAFCSGSLIGPDLILTAGHCVSSCDESVKYVFDYAIHTPGENPDYLNVENVYTCKEVVALALDDTTLNDYAIVRLNKEVTGREPLAISRKGDVEVGQSIFVIGHPAGLPTKYAPGANIRSTSQEYFYEANLDTYGGNSGSGVFNAETGEIEGVLVRGEQDFEFNMQLLCNQSKICKDDECMGEHVTKISKIIAEVNL